jgi:hypothetical protein
LENTYKVLRDSLNMYYIWELQSSANALKQIDELYEWNKKRVASDFVAIMQGQNKNRISTVLPISLFLLLGGRRRDQKSHS